MLPAGTKINAKLIEEVEKDHWIVSFQGELIQVKNSTDIKFKKNLTLTLQVVKQSPFELKVLSKENSRKLTGLDIRV